MLRTDLELCLCDVCERLCEDDDATVRQDVEEAIDGRLTLRSQVILHIVLQQNQHMTDDG